MERPPVVSRRRLLRLMGVAAVAGVAAACSAPTPPAPNQPTASATTGAQPSAGQPRSGGTLRVGVVGDLPNLDGHFINGDNTIYPIGDRLVDLDANLNPVPLLAESWDVDSDYTKITVKLRQGVKWHTGRDFG